MNMVLRGAALVGASGCISLKPNLGSDPEMVEAARKQTEKSLLSFANKKLPERQADADEARDQVTLDPRRVPQVRPTTPVALTECIGVFCSLRSDACDTCYLNAFVENEEENHE